MIFGHTFFLLQGRRKTNLNFTRGATPALLRREAVCTTLLPSRRRDEEGGCQCNGYTSRSSASVNVNGIVPDVVLVLVLMLML